MELLETPGVIHTYIHVCLYKFELTVAHLCPITACGMVSFGAFSASSYLVSTTVYLEAWYFYWNVSALLLWQIEPLCHFQNSPKKVRRSRPRKRERSTRRSTWESGVRRCAISWSSPSISSHININHLILITVNVIITVNVFIISSSLAVMTMTVKKTEKRQQKFFTNQVGSLKPQSRWIWSTKKDYEKFVLALIIR